MRCTKKKTMQTASLRDAVVPSNRYAMTANVVASRMAIGTATSRSGAVPCVLIVAGALRRLTTQVWAPIAWTRNTKPIQQTQPYSNQTRYRPSNLPSALATCLQRLCAPTRPPNKLIIISTGIQNWIERLRVLPRPMTPTDCSNAC